MCDTVIDEHFRRSLGNNYMELFDKTGATAGTSPTGAVPSVAVAPVTAAVVAKTATKRVVKSPQPAPVPVAVAPVKKEEVVVAEKEDSNVNFSVDDHFAKALGETWNKLKAGQRRDVEEVVDGDDNSETEDDSGSEGGDNSGDSGESRNRNRRKSNKRLRTERRRD